MVHPLVEQLRFARIEFRRCLEGVSADDAERRLLPMNSISWIICHLAGQERRFWLIWAQGRTDVAPELDEWGHIDKPANTPPLAGAWASWETVRAAVDPYLDALTQVRLLERLDVNGAPMESNIGTMLRRSTYHYWYHTGEANAIRQLLRHQNVPELVGEIQKEAPYRPE
ncbi:MAG TPA: DinB family protein [Thermomicrobiales bacterium]|jgi:hypothetical protein|nr:DinB family protein [Thermomicrobiales bacterium]